MNRFWVAGALPAFLLLALGAPRGLAMELQPGINTAHIIEFPTALDQPVDHTLGVALDVVDFGEPDIRTKNLRYGYQWGNVQLLADAHYIPEPDRKFDHGEARAKLRLLTLDDYLASFAVGVLGRYTDTKEGDARIDDKPYSFLGVFTVELFPFDNWGGFLTNLYVDNRWASLGLKVQLIQQVKFVGEYSWLHSTDIEERGFGKVGIEIEGEQVFYFQLLFDDRTENAVIQLGTGF